MRSAAYLRLATCVATCAPLACSLVRDFDGFSDQYRDAGNEAATDAPVPVGDGGSDAPADGPLDPPRKPIVSCDDLVPVVTNLPFDMDASGYPFALAVDEHAFYLATGVYQPPPDSGLSLRDAGVIAKFDKTGATVDALVIGEPVAYRLTAREGAIFYVSAARDGGALYRLYARAPDGTIYELLGDLNPPEIAAAQDGLFVGLRQSGLLGHFPWDASAAEIVWKTVGGPVRVLADDERVLVQRVRGEEAGVSSYATTSWQSGPSPVVGCSLDSGVDAGIIELALSGERFFYTQNVNSRTELFAANRTTCAHETVLTDGRIVGLAANDRFLFVRYPDKVRLFWADNPTVAICEEDIPLEAQNPLSRVRGVNAAMFDPSTDDVFFILPPFVYRLKVTVGP